MEDLHAVLDATGSEKAVILGSHEGCGMGALFAATYPEWTRALVLFHPEVRGVLHERGDASDAGLRQLIEVRDRWGSQEFADDLLRELCPTLYASGEDRRQFAK
jgi:pimeloyl-ACP methyl ester carboxylesterase